MTYWLHTTYQTEYIMSENKSKAVIGLIVSTVLLVGLSYGLIELGVSGVQAVSSQIALAVVGILFLLSGVWVYQQNVRTA